jgi:hypothetical protein
MAATLTGNLNLILKDFYSGPVRDQLNNEMLALQLFKKRKLTWVGRQAIMPVRLARNASDAFLDEGDPFGVTGQVTYGTLTVAARYLYGRMSITGPAIAQAKASVGAFVNGLQSELDGAVETVKNAADEALFIGGGTIGFLNEQVTRAGAHDWQFSGNADRLPNVAGPITAVNARIIRCDTFADITPAGAFTVQGVYAAGALQPGLIAVNQALNTVAVPAGVACAVVVEKWTDGAAGPLTSKQPMGMYGSIGAGSFVAGGATGPLYHAVDRSAGVSAPLRGTAITQSTAGGGGNRADLTVKRLQSVIDEVSTKSGAMPDCLIAHYILRQEYSALLANNLRVDVKTGAGKGDAGFNMGMLSFNGIPLKTSRHCGKGLLLFIKTDAWVMAEVTPPGLADLDGNVLSRTGTSDAYNAFVRYYYNTVCEHPNKNAVLVGLNFSGA